MFLAVFSPASRARSRFRSRPTSPPGTPRPAGLYLIKAIFLMSLAVLAFGLLCASPASAQGGYPGGGYPGGGYPGGGYPGGGYPGGGYPGGGGWVPSDSSGTPLQSVNSDGGANLLPTLGHQPKMTNTYPIPDSEDNWWFSVFSPNTHTTANPYYYYNRLHLDGHAGNSILDNSRYGHAVGTYAPDPWDPGEWMSGQTMPPDLNGKVHADNSDTLAAYFVWTGDQAHIPPHQDFLLNTSVSATAGAYFGTGGATSGLSATATGTLEADTVTAQAGDAGSASPPPLTKRVLVHATPNGNLITLSRSASVSLDVSDHLPFSKWSDGEAQGGTSYYPYTGDLNGETSASASADVSATAKTDSRDVTVSSDLGQTYHKGPQSDGHGFALPEADSPNSDGMGFATTVVPYLNSPSTNTYTADGYSTSTILYHANPTGSWAADSSYQWKVNTGDTSGSIHSLGGTFAAPDDPPYDITAEYIPRGQAFGNVSAGSSEQVSITLTDAGDGATATAGYHIDFHDPTENWFLWNTENSFWDIIAADNVQSPGYALHGSGISANWTYTDTVWAEAGEAFTAVGGHMVENPYWAGLLEAASIAFSKVEPEPLNQTVNFNNAWTDSHSTFSPQPGDSTESTQTLYEMVPVLCVQYQPQIWRADAYAASGYTGGVETSLDKFQRVDTAGDFTLITADPTGGH